MALSCELCGNTQFLKQDGVFVCQGCGTKYTLEEARKLMGNAPSVTTTTVATVEGNQVKSPNESAIEKYLTLAQNAYHIKNFSESLSYANKILELDPTHSRAWFLKGSSLCWTTNTQQGITIEMINCFAQAENNISEADKGALKSEMGNDLWQVSNGLITSACNLFCQSPGDYRDNVLWLYDHILKIVPGFIEVCLDENQSKEFIKVITEVIWQVAIDVYGSVRNDRWDPHHYFSYYSTFAYSCLSLLERCAEVPELPADSRWKLYNNVETICVDVINDYPQGYFDAIENSVEIFLRGYNESLEHARRQMRLLKSTNKIETQEEATEPQTPKEPEVVYCENVYVTDNPYEVPGNFEFVEAITKGSLWSGIATDYGIQRAIEKIQKAAADKGCHLALITQVDTMFGVSISADLYRDL